MPLSTTDPTTYPEGFIFATLSKIVALSQDPYEETFETSGDAINWAHKFYSWRKAIRYYIDKTLTEATQQTIEPEAYTQLQARIKHNEDIFYYANMIKITRPGGKNSKICRMIIKEASATPTSTTADFIAKHKEYADEEVKLLFGLDNESSE